MQRRQTTVGLDFKSSPLALRRRRSPRRATLTAAAGVALLLATVVWLRPTPPAPVTAGAPDAPPQAAVEPALSKEKDAGTPLVTRVIALPGQQLPRIGAEPLSTATTEEDDLAPTPAQVAPSPVRSPSNPQTTADHTPAAPSSPPTAAEQTPPALAMVAAKATVASSALAPTVPEPNELTLTVHRGDSLDRLFRRHGLSVGDLHQMLRLDEAAQALRMVRPGDEITIRRDGASVLALSRRLDDFRLLKVGRAEQGYEAAVSIDAPERRVTHAHGRITSSLFNAGRAAGISDNLVMELAGVFAWDIDFVLDIRKGDEFLVLYEELWRDGQKLRDGAILAAEFVNTGDRYRALRYVDPAGRADYYTPEGLSLRKAFLRAPVDFSRISSNFNPNRRHPILNTIRAHRGVDYAAPAGTPVKAAGDGKVSFRGVQSGYGNTVILQHGENISTLYAHLSRFSSYKRGARVSQGDVIGYVGKTGLASGNHLHYEYRVAGVHRNPRTVKLPQADPIPESLRADFDAHAEHVLAQLQLVKNVRLAAAAGSGSPPAAE